MKQDQLRKWMSTWRRVWGMREGGWVSDIEGPCEEHSMNRSDDFLC